MTVGEFFLGRLREKHLLFKYVIDVLYFLGEVVGAYSVSEGLAFIRGLPMNLWFKAHPGVLGGIGEEWRAIRGFRDVIISGELGGG